MLNNLFRVNFYWGRFLYLSLSLILFCSGCALQSSLVDLEEGVDTIQKRQQELLLLSEKLNEMSKTGGPSTPVASLEGRAMLLEKINRLEEQLRSLEGRIEEEGQKGLTSMRTLDDQAHQVNSLPNRIDLLEKRVTTLESRGGFQARAESGTTTRTESGTSTVTEGGTKDEGKNEKGDAPRKSAVVSPTEAYRLAYNDYLRGNYSLAVMSFQNYIEQYPTSTFLPEAFYWLGQSHYNQGEYEEAILFLEQVYIRYPTHEKVPSAKMKEARALIEMKEQERAKALLLAVIEQYPQSNEAFMAKEALSNMNSPIPQPKSK